MSQVRPQGRAADASDGRVDGADEFTTDFADHALVTIGVLNCETVDQAAAITGKGAQVTITCVGKSADKQIQLAANDSVVSWQRRILIRGVVLHAA